MRFQGLGAILDWLTTRLDFMQGLEIECTLLIHDYNYINIYNNEQGREDINAWLRKTLWGMCVHVWVVGEGGGRAFMVTQELFSSFYMNKYILGLHTSY